MKLTWGCDGFELETSQQLLVLVETVSIFLKTTQKPNISSKPHNSFKIPQKLKKSTNVQAKSAHSSFKVTSPTASTLSSTLSHPFSIQTRLKVIDNGRKGKINLKQLLSFVQESVH